MDIRVDTHTDLLVAARTAHMRRDWHASYEAYVRAGEDVPLGTDDLDALAVAAWRLGRGKESVRVAERVFAQLARTDPASAAMKAVELGLAWLTRGDLNIGQGWMNRARRLLAGAPECPTHGYLAYLDALVAVLTHDSDALADRVRTLRELRGRLGTPALTALGLVTEALAAIFDARMAEGYGLLDEAMLPVLADQVPIEWAGGGRGRSRWSGGATTSPSRPPTAGCATCTAYNCSPRPPTTARARIDWSPPAGRWRTSTAGLPHRGTTNSARPAGCAATPTAPSPRSSGRGRWGSSRNPARRCCVAGWATVRPRPPTCGSRWQARTGWAACGCCDQPSRWRSPAIASTRPTGTVANSIPAPRLSAPPAFGPGPRTPAAPSWCSGYSMARPSMR